MSTPLFRRPVQLSASMTFGSLRWFAIVAPVVFIAALWTLLHGAFYGLHRFPEVLIVLGGLVGGVGVFAFGVFALVRRLEQRILQQNVELEQRNQELGALLEVGHAASSSLELGELLDRAMDAILEVARADAAEVWLGGDGDGDELKLARHRGARGDVLAERTRLRYGEGLPGLAAERRMPIVVHDLPVDDRFVRERVKALGFQTYCGLPLLHSDRVVGVLGIASRDPSRLCSSRELGLLQGIAERVAAAVTTARLHERVLDGAVVEERLRIARELHDGLAQVLGYITTQTLAVKRLLDTGKTPAAREELDAMEDASRQVYGDVREAILGLRVSIPRTGLVATLQRYVEEHEEMPGTELRLAVRNGVQALELSPAAEIQLFHIVQEALNNVRKHARAPTATVTAAAEDGELVVEVADDGQGFDPARVSSIGWPRFGLQTMRERAQSIGGRFELESRPGAGTRVRVRVPLETAAEAEGASAAR